ncbi:hypothetical protein HB780_09600 (plasmid) [Rhizobium lusitanum]|uniref:hypothetical protein n=1 Tax=Rhizobium lusitanum TaxID=293958 RepID=UPI0016144B4F|nr:hypothetical protein [Rhizobium lusitanum]QND45957.1 hypothetical protein HB780_09600 [Rhizobium lusitanum]
MKRSELLLPPTTRQDSRIWLNQPHGTIGAAPLETIIGQFGRHKTLTPKTFHCRSLNGDLSTFATAIRLLEKLCEEPAIGVLSGQLGRLIDGMRKACAEEAHLDSAAGLEGAIQKNGDALAALRRISRESMVSSNLIDQAARCVLAALDAAGYTHVVISSAEIIDRPSLKLFARACLLTPENSRLVWIWTATASNSWKTHPGLEFGMLPVCARENFMEAIKSVLQPLELDAPQGSHEVGTALKTHIAQRGVGGATGWLANLNYDACAHWAAAQADPGVDDCRLIALLMVNLGLYDDAVDILQRAIAICSQATLRCHLWYVSGLIWSKRLYNVARSNACFDMGDAALESVAAGDGGDPHMERAWVQNGRAMNAILAARLAHKPISTAFPIAFSHLTRAFDLVRDGGTRDRVYLRFNLLGNMSNLMEIGGNYAVALDLLNRTFDESLARGAENEREWIAQQRCMRAALMARAGDAAAAIPIFAEARELMQQFDRPISAEALGRSQAKALYQSGAYGEARELFSTCLDEARALRSRLGVQTHVIGLAACEISLGREKTALSLLRTIGELEDVWALPPAALASADLSGLRIQDAYYGLSLSIPEVDLEDMAPASIAGALRGRQTEVDAVRALKK